MVTVGVANVEEEAGEVTDADGAQLNVPGPLQPPPNASSHVMLPKQIDGGVAVAFNVGETGVPGTVNVFETDHGPPLLEPVAISRMRHLYWTPGHNPANGMTNVV